VEGNSAGQAAVFLSQYAAKVFILVRGPSLAASMSRYLIDRIDATPNIQLRPHTEFTQLLGELPGGLAAVSWRSRHEGMDQQRPLRNVFLFVGAEPETGWVRSCGVALDSQGFVLTGPAMSGVGRAGRGQISRAARDERPGVFAVGDVRSGSVKRVGGAIGEGAAVVAQIHRYLAVARSSSQSHDPPRG
jgi:thioredoxin reductase (NADPH)